MRGAFMAMAILVAGSAAAAEEKPHRHGQDEGARHHPGMRGSAAAFHDLMRPLWHSPAGAARVDAVCGKSSEIVQRIADIVAERADNPVPATMAATAKNLQTACAEARVEAVEPALDTLHQQFHELMGMGGGRQRR